MHAIWRLMKCRLTLDDQLADYNNDWDLEHYYTRLDDYYKGDAEAALAVLDTVAIHRRRKFTEIRSAVASLMTTPPNDEKLRKILKWLCKDHYLDHRADGTYVFYLAIISRWWRIYRDLQEVQ